MTRHRADALPFDSMFGEHLEVPLLSDLASPSAAATDLPPAQGQAPVNRGETRG
jgi:hypothetical protein